MFNKSVPIILKIDMTSKQIKKDFKIVNTKYKNFETIDSRIYKSQRCRRTLYLGKK